MTYDYTAAIDEVEKWQTTCHESLAFFKQKGLPDEVRLFISAIATHDTILHALRLAQKVSEPSEGMIDAARGHIGHPAHYKSVFTAMIKQACAEIEDGQI